MSEGPLLRTGREVPASGRYRSSCHCSAQMLARGGEAAPDCPRCGKPVGWTLVKAVTFGPAGWPLDPPPSPPPASEKSRPPALAAESKGRRKRSSS